MHEGIEYDQELIEMYESGHTGYQVMMDAPEPTWHRTSPLRPPEENLDEMLEYARRYDPRRPRSASLIPPAEDQVRAAERWICGQRMRSSKFANL